MLRTRGKTVDMALTVSRAADMIAAAETLCGLMSAWTRRKELICTWQT